MDFLTALRAEIDAELAAIFDESSPKNPAPAEAELWAAMRHAALLGGKRVRPALGLLIFDALGGGPAARSAARRGLCAVELVHAYSLAHDDLPAMDDDTIRRGQPTVWKKFGEATAILVGDALQSLAFEILAKNPAATAALARAAGQMCFGQALDLAGEPPSDAALRDLCAKKTGALLGAAAEIGAIFVGAGDEKIRAARDFGAGLGLAFQIRDDLLDFDGDPAKTGKNPRDDAAKKGFVRVLGPDGAAAALTKKTAENLATAKNFGGENLVKLARFVAERDR